MSFRGLGAGAGSAWSQGLSRGRELRRGSSRAQKTWELQSQDTPILVSVPACLQELRLPHS